MQYVLGVKSFKSKDYLNNELVDLYSLHTIFPFLSFEDEIAFISYLQTSIKNYVNVSF